MSDPVPSEIPEGSRAPAPASISMAREADQERTTVHRAEVELSGLTKPYLLPKESPLHVPPHVALARIDDDMEVLKNQIRILKERNFIKDRGKKFEGSYTRIGFIMIITYATISIYMSLIGVKDPLLNAIVPTVGFNLSTWSLPWVKRLWMAFYDWNYGNGRNHMTFEEYEALERAEMGLNR